MNTKNLDSPEKEQNRVETEAEDYAEEVRKAVAASGGSERREDADR